jgi:hypothetical protein
MPYVFSYIAINPVNSLNLFAFLKVIFKPFGLLKCDMRLMLKICKHTALRTFRLCEWPAKRRVNIGIAAEKRKQMQGSGNSPNAMLPP